MGSPFGEVPTFVEAFTATHQPYAKADEWPLRLWH